MIEMTKSSLWEKNPRDGVREGKIIAEKIEEDRTSG